MKADFRRRDGKTLDSRIRGNDGDLRRNDGGLRRNDGGLRRNDGGQRRNDGLLRRIARLPILFFCVLTLSACATRPDLGAVPLDDTPHTIWFIYRDWHTSVMLDAASYNRLSKLPLVSTALNTEVAPAGYVRIGWGDGDYYTGKSTSVMTATRALVASKYSAIQVIGYTADPFERIPAETRVPLRITDDAMRELVTYLDASFVQDPEGKLHQLHAYVDNSGVFFEASRSYGLFNNCNTWSGDALRAAGLPIRSSFNLTAKSVFEQARAIAEFQARVTRRGQIPIFRSIATAERKAHGKLGSDPI